MKLFRVKLHNFRGVLDAKIDFQSYTLLVGPNNAGKSTFIDAIRAFYEKDSFKFVEKRDFPLIPTTDKASWIEMTFELNDAEQASLKDEYQVANQQLRVRKVFQADKNSDDKSEPNFIYAYEKNGELSKDSFYGAKNVQSGKFGDLIYIPAVSKVEDHTKLSGPSALRDLLNGLMARVVEDGSAYKEFEANVQAFEGKLLSEETNDGLSLNGFASEVNALLAPWQTKFELRVPPPSSGNIVKQMVTWELHDSLHQQIQSIDNYGSGFQRHFIYSMIRIGSQYVPPKPSKKKTDFTPTLTLILFEEPEAFLHPPQQDILARSLMNLAKQEHSQVVCTTHSANFVSRKADNIPAIVRVERAGGGISIFQFSAEAWVEIVNSNQAFAEIVKKHPKINIHSDDLKAEMEAVKHFLWLNTDRAGLFFANHVLLVEGPTEVALINKLLDDGQISGIEGGLHVMDTLGKYNTHRFMSLLSHLGIKHTVLLDDDNQKNEHLDINKLVEASRREQTFAIEWIKKDLEAFLDVPSAGKKHRKPQHLLYYYTKGKIDKAKLKKFCELVSACLPTAAAVRVKQPPPQLSLPLGES